MRTESDSVVTTHTKGDKSTHTRGVNESHSIIQTVCVGGGNLTMIRVPYSRINGFYMIAAGPGFDKDMYLGDDENEFSADTHGLPAYYIQHVGPWESVAQFMQDFLSSEKKNP